MIRFMKEHPWRSSALVAVLLLCAALAVVMVVRRSGSDAGDRGELSGPSERHAEHGASPPTTGRAGYAGSGAVLPDGYAPVAVDPSQAAAMGLTTTRIAARDFTRTVRTVGIVAVDATRTAHVHARVRGWIERFHVQYVGRKVKKGEPLVSVYSQEVYAAQLELASLLRSPVHSPELLDAARKRFTLWDVPASVVAAVEKTGQPQRTFPVLSPRSGVVVAKQAFDGQFIDPSTELYTISDLSRVWVVADIYDADVADVRVGTTAKLHVDGVAEPITADVAFLHPTIDERTRTRKARFELSSVGPGVMPGAFVTVEMELALGRGVAVPESAVIRTGERAIVFVVHGGTHAEPREIGLGARVGDYFRVTRGLEIGEYVATGAQFLLDSESRLRATGGGGGGHAGH